jgi:hypothetical protein
MLKSGVQTKTAQPFGKRKSTLPQKLPAKPVRKTPFTPLSAPAFSVTAAASIAPSITPAAPASANADERADLTTFFGPGTDKYLRLHDRLTANPSSLAFNWAAFSLAFVWFFYRKMYLLGALLVVLAIVAGYAQPFGAGVSAGIFGFFADRAYICEAKRRIKKADNLGLTGEERAAYLRRVGGVSIPAGIIAGLLYAGLGALAFLW